MTICDSRAQPAAADSFEPVRRAVDQRLLGLLQCEADRWRRVDPALGEGFDLLERFVRSGGKRLRPAFAFWGFVGRGGDAARPAIVELGAALEMLHTFALVHDDVMDGSDTRRHAPCVHRALEAVHVRNGWRGEPRRFGEGVAVMLGDLAFAYADQLAAELPPEVRRQFCRLKIELHMGQFLDLWGAAERPPSSPRFEAVIRYKTAGYSVEGPLRLGAALAGAERPEPDPDRARRADADRALEAFGLAVGEAFQLRDDVLGAFGDPAVTGKPLGDDFREGKETMLVHEARARAASSGPPGAAGRALALLDRLGAGDLTDAEVASLQELIVCSGALGRVERRIGELWSTAERALAAAQLRPDAADALTALARRAVWRTA
ncbi:MAG: polyprenyl synthetase family protein [Acidimicrobiales bacterium]